MKIFSLATICLLSLFPSISQGGIRGIDNNNHYNDDDAMRGAAYDDYDNNYNNNGDENHHQQYHRRLGGQMIMDTTTDQNQGGAAQNVPFERNNGTCVDATTAYQGSTFLQSQYNTVQDFVSYCGPQGTCMGGQEGCCRFNLSPALFCDRDRTYFTALCICNEFTSQPRSGGGNSGGGGVIVFPPVPTPPPTSIRENCQRWNVSSPHRKNESNPFSAFGQNCTADSQCPTITTPGVGGVGTTTTQCCMSNFCLCKTEKIPTNVDFPCVGDWE